jgi:oxalate decarboxylase/phosphoglucose isomerase-like protein (cupin superfamily)
MLTAARSAYIPASYGHYIENTGNNTLIYLEISNTGARLCLRNRGLGD